MPMLHLFFKIKIYIEEKYKCQQVQARKFKQVSLRAEGLSSSRVLPRRQAAACSLRKREGMGF